MKEKLTGIYRIKNLINNKIYIGSSVNIKERWSEHKRCLRKNEHHSQYLQNAWNKYGQQNFKFEVVEECKEDELLKREQYYLDLYESYNNKNGYNISKSSSSPMKGRKHSEETKKKLKEDIANRDSSSWIRGEDKTNSKFKNEDIVNIKKMIYEGKRIIDIAKIYNVEANTITQIKTGERWNHIKTEYDDLIIQTPKQKLSEEDIINIKKLLVSNEMSIKEIAIIYNITFGMISCIKRLDNWKDVGSEYNEELLKRSVVRKLNKNKVIEIKKLLEEGVTCTKIAELFQVNRITISDIKNNKTWKEVS